LLKRGVVEKKNKKLEHCAGVIQLLVDWAIRNAEVIRIEACGCFCPPSLFARERPQRLQPSTLVHLSQTSTRVCNAIARYHEKPAFSIDNFNAAREDI